MKGLAILVLAAAGIALALVVRKRRGMFGLDTEHAEEPLRTPRPAPAVPPFERIGSDLPTSEDDARPPAVSLAASHPEGGAESGIEATAIRSDVPDSRAKSDNVDGLRAPVVGVDLPDASDRPDPMERTRDDGADEFEAVLERPAAQGRSDAEPAAERGRGDVVDRGERPNVAAPAAAVVAPPGGPRGDGESAPPEPIAARTRTPRQYRPPRGATGRPTTRRAAASPASAPDRERSLDIEVRLVFDRGGFCRLSLMPDKDERVGGEVIADGTTGQVELVPLQDDLYSDVFPPDLGTLLRNGIVWSAALEGGTSLRWSLTGREVYVLGSHERVSGYLSMPRVLLGADHVVLCTNERASQVAAVIEASGSPPPTVFGSVEGLPEGWTGFRGVSPATPIPQTDDHDILNILRARPDISIVLEGGIRIGRSTWLAEFPPEIRIRGACSATRGVWIDGIQAVRTAEGPYAVPGCDGVGDHTISCGDQSRTYQIRPGLEQWDGWDAYRWSLEGVVADGVPARPSLCGAVIRAPRKSASEPPGRVVATRNAVLVGAVPGEIAYASMRATHQGLASVAFEPVWALPADPFHSDKRVARIVALAITAPQPGNTTSAGRRHLEALRAWCDAILDSGRKGLAIQPDDPERTALWSAYRRHAKALRKRLR